MSFLGKKTPNPNLELIEDSIPNFVKRFELLEEVLYGGDGHNIITRLEKLEKKVNKYVEEGSLVDKNDSVLNTENAVNEADDEGKNDDVEVINEP